MGRQRVGIGKTGPIEPWVPMMLFAILFGLSMDYEVFLLSASGRSTTAPATTRSRSPTDWPRPARVITAAARDHGVRLRQLRARRPRVAQAVRLRSGGRGPHRRHRRAAWCWCRRRWSCSATRNWWLPKWLDRLLPRLHVEAGPDIDEELARLAAEDEAIRQELP